MARFAPPAIHESSSIGVPNPRPNHRKLGLSYLMMQPPLQEMGLMTALMGGSGGGGRNAPALLKTAQADVKSLSDLINDLFEMAQIDAGGLKYDDSSLQKIVIRLLLINSNLLTIFLEGRMSVRYAVLGLIAQKPRHGYETRVAFEALVGGDKNWEVKPAQIYMTLERLEEAGMIERCSDLGEGDEPSRRIYQITPRGETALRDWFASPVASEHQRDDFFIKLIVGIACKQSAPERLIQTQRALLFQEMHAATNQREAYDPTTEIAQILLLDKVIMHLEADLRWLDMIEMRLPNILQQPLPEPEMNRRGRPRKGEKGSTYPPPPEQFTSHS